MDLKIPSARGDFYFRRLNFLANLISKHRKSIDMKKQTLLLFFLAITALNSYAQIRRTPVKPASDSSITQSSSNIDKKELMKELNLSPEQRTKMKEIRESAQAARQAVTADSTLSNAEKRAKLRSIRKEQNNKVNAILTEEQRTKLEAWKKKNGMKE